MSWPRGLWALTVREVKKWLKDPVLLLVTVIQPFVWMVFFGKSMNIGRLLSGLPPGMAESIMGTAFGTSDYFSYMAIGMISFTAMFTTMFTGMSIVWDRRLGFLNKILSTPVPRGTIVLSKVLNSAIRSIFQATVIFTIALFLGLRLSPSFSPVNVLLIYGAIFLFCVGISFIFLTITLRATKIEAPMTFVNLVNLPLMFASNVFFPTEMMPDWIRAIAKVNPVTYLTDACRQLTVWTTDYHALAVDFVYLGTFAAVLSAVGILLAKRYLSR
jgi:ABC-2 type transport system permease protein